MEIGQCRACGNSAEWCAVHTGCSLNKGKEHLPYKPEGVHPEANFGVPQKDKIEVCPMCGEAGAPKLLLSRREVTSRLFYSGSFYSNDVGAYCRDDWHWRKREDRKHSFVWYNLGENKNVVGASVKEAREILKDALSLFIKDVYGSFYFPSVPAIPPAGLFPVDYVAGKRRWWDW